MDLIGYGYGWDHLNHLKISFFFIDFFFITEFLDFQSDSGKKNRRVKYELLLSHCINSISSFVSHLIGKIYVGLNVSSYFPCVTIFLSPLYQRYSGSTLWITSFSKSVSFTDLSVPVFPTTTRNSWIDEHLGSNFLLSYHDTSSMYGTTTSICFYFYPSIVQLVCFLLE